MKSKKYGILSGVILAAGLIMTAGTSGVSVFAASSDAGDFAVSTSDSENFSTADTVIEWEDEGMEKFVRSALGRSQGDITSSELEGVKVLRIGQFDDGPKAAIMMNTATDPGDLSSNDEVSVDEQLSGVEIYSLDDLKWMPNLETLEVEGFAAEDISVLGGMENLDDLDLSETGVSDISAIGSLQNLTVLDLRNTKITDISALSGLQNLYYLSLSGTKITDISALSGMQSLHKLYLEDTGITDINALSGMTDLTNLNLDNTGIKDISLLSELTNLTCLYIQIDTTAIPKEVHNFPMIFLDKSRCCVAIGGYYMDQAVAMSADIDHFYGRE